MQRQKPERVEVGNAILYHARWEDVAAEIMHADAVISDPPYGMGGIILKRFPERRAGAWPSIIDDNTAFDPAPWLGFDRVVLFGSNHYAQRLPVGTTLIWLKRNIEHLGKFLSDAEVAWMKGGNGVYVKQLVDSPTTRQYESAHGRNVHPTQKPIRLMQWVMERAQVPTDAVVLDPFMGSGTTGVACALTGRPFIGVECQQEYFDAAVHRMRTALRSYEPMTSRPEFKLTACNEEASV